MPSVIIVGFLFLGIMLLNCLPFYSHLLHYFSLAGPALNTPPLLKDVFSQVLTNTPLKLLGSLVIYILAKNYKFFTIMISIILCNLFAACVFSFVLNDFTLIPLTQLYFMPALILAALFCFKMIPSKYHNTVSVYISLAVAFGGILACSIKNIAIHMHTSFWSYALIFVTTCTLCFFLAAKIYCFETDLQASEKNIHVEKIQFSSYILLFLSGALLGIVVGFPMLFSKPYFTEALILSFGRNMSPLYFHWISLFLFLLPAHYILKKNGFLKAMLVSILGVVFLVAILWQNAEITILIYSVFRLIFAFCSALILAPLFLIVYKAAQKTNSIYSPVLWTSWGGIMTIALRAFIGQAYPELPVLLVGILMLLTLLLLYLFALTKHFQKDLASFSYSFSMPTTSMKTDG